MAKYDENLKENPFFIYVKENHANVIKQAAEENWLLCIPRKATILNTAFTQVDVLKHTLVPDDSNENVFTTLTDQQVHLLKDALVTDEEVHDKSPNKKKVLILFSEVLYDEFGKYGLMCLECPLFWNKPVDSLPSILSIHDAINFLCQGLQNFTVMHNLDSLAEDVSLKCEKISELQPLIEVVINAYQLGCSLVMNQSSFKAKVTSDPYYKKLLETSVITYLQHKIFPSLVAVLNVFACAKDATLNLHLNNASGITCTDVNLQYSDNYNVSVKELRTFFKFQTFIDKAECIKKVIATLCAEIRCATTDELIPNLCYVVVKTAMPNWYAHMMFLKHFHIDGEDKQTGENYFHFATLEAVLEFISTGGLYKKIELEHDQEDSGNFLLKSEVQKLLTRNNDEKITEYFQYIQHSQLVEINALFEESSFKSKDDIKKKLCHPLCTCPRCSTLLDQVKNSCVSAKTSDSEGFTGLHAAAFFGCPKVIKLLLKRGANVNARCNQGSTALHFASMKGHKNCVLLLLHNGADIGIANSRGYMPLHLAAENGHVSCVKSLLFYAELHGSIDCMAVDNNGDTPLHLACRWGFQDVIIVLLEQMKDGNYDLMVKNKAGFASTDLCLNRELRKLVLNAHQQRASNNHLRPEIFLCKRVSIDSGCISQSSPAITTVKGTPNASDDISCSMVPSKNVTATHELDYSIVDPPIKELTQSESRQLDEAVCAIQDGEIEKALRLLSVPTGNFDKDAKLSSLCHPLCQCCECLKTMPVDDRQNACGFINSLGTAGLGVLHVATMGGLAKLVKILLCNNCNPNVLSGLQNGSATALHMACETGNYAIAQMLLQYGADVDAIDINGNTPLHISAAGGNARLLHLLISSGASISSINYNGQSPEDVARQFGYLASVEMLQPPLSDYN
ncbi:ankyrin repeat domain-containing protein 27-like [Hyalella azteca]|uniref:Ankyrin repeat domain-containing protein 27-like n=1 Tax=Hyalella azteca TaxID=294128 RepID=A0A979FNS8_HYAAZ|nr:ankyrin repeat domain-containing protein 27-like [Hyalella azteca]